MKRKKLWIGLLIVTACGLFLTVHLARAALQPLLPVEPVWGRKPVLEYFVLTAGLSDRLQQEVGLSPVQFQFLQALARREADQLRDLQQASAAALADVNLSDEEKRARIQASGYNDQLRQVIAANQQALQAGLGVVTSARLVDWIERSWLVERAQHGLQTFQADAVDAARTYYVRMTYDDSDGYVAFLPDQCVKFSNQGLNTWCTDYGYVVGGNYSIRLRYGDKRVTIRPKDVGPWNINDTYWATTDDPTPRRKFTDLPLGMPEAQAAYYDDYNDGKDEFGRIVTAPYAVEVTYDVAPDLGLTPGQNVWLYVSFLWTDGWDATPTPPPSPTPTATPTPTPTPTPSPYLSVGAGQIQPGQVFTAPVSANNLSAPGLGSTWLDLQYDPAVVSVSGCQADPAGVFMTSGCLPDFDQDGIYPDTVRFSVYSLIGVTGTAQLAEIALQAVGLPGSYSPLNLIAGEIADPAGAPLEMPVYGAGACLAPCQQVYYFPLFARDLSAGP